MVCVGGWGKSYLKQGTCCCNRGNGRKFRQKRMIPGQICGDRLSTNIQVRSVGELLATGGLRRSCIGCLRDRNLAGRRCYPFVQRYLHSFEIEELEYGRL